MKHQLQKRWLVGVTASVIMSLSLTAIADSSRAFVPMGTSDSVGVIDLANYQVTATIPGTINTHGSALTPDGRYLVVGSLTARESQSEVIRPESVTEDEHAVHHGNESATAGENTNTGLIYLVDTNTNLIDRVIEVPGPVHHEMVTADGR